jgi:pimeloyl-ACP methyl ester carboxylesterase
VRIGDAGPTLLWIHGLGERAATFAPAIERLPQYRHVLIALPGHGVAPAATPRSIVDTADALCEWWRGDAPIVVGHSLGGVIAVTMAERAPHAVRAVIDVDGNVSLGDCTYSGQMAAMDRDTYITAGHGAVCDRIVAAAGDAIVRGYGERVRATDPAQLHRYACDLVAWSSTEDSARRRAACGVPLTYLAGDPGGACRRSRELLAAAAVTTVPIAPAGHWPFLDQPDAFAAAVASATAAAR